MARSNFGIANSIHYVNIDVSDLRGIGGKTYPCLVIPITLNFSEPKNYNHQTQIFEIISIKSELKTVSNNSLVSETFLMTNGIVDRATDRRHELKFKLNEHLILFLEKTRNNNLELFINFDFQIGMYDKISIQNQRGENTEKKFITSFERANSQLNFTIEQSFWVNNILTSIGHNSYRLIELPAINQVIPEEYKMSIVEFDQAQKYFTNGDYDKVVAHCRAALDPFKKKLPELKAFIKSKSEFDWANDVLGSTETWLDKIIRSTAAFTSKTHHAPSVGHFGRTDAEIVLLITTGIIAYIGKIEYKSE